MENNPNHFQIENLRGISSLGATGSNHPYDFTVGTGEVGIVFGGKDTSSLLRLLLGLGTLNSGDVKIAGESIFRGNLSSEEILSRRQRIGFAFRDKGLISNLSIKDNVDLPAKYHGYYRKGSGNAPGSLAEAALDELEVGRDLWTQRPNRINWEVRKKVLLARSIVLNPSVLILDDPSAMAASPFISFLLKWVLLQKKKGTAILIGSEDYPFSIAIGDWALHPATGTKIKEYSGFIDSCWIESASILKKRIVELCS